MSQDTFVDIQSWALSEIHLCETCKPKEKSMCVTHTNIVKLISMVKHLDHQLQEKDSDRE